MPDCLGLYSVKKPHQQEEKEEEEQQRRERSQEGDERKINLVYFREIRKNNVKLKIHKEKQKQKTKTNKQMKMMTLVAYFLSSAIKQKHV